MDKILDVPFYPQSWDLDSWQSEGYSSRDDMKYWEVSSCGILCLQMVLVYFGKKVQTKELINRGSELGIYTHRHGWAHRGMVDFARRLGLLGTMGYHGAQSLTEAIDKNKLPIVSIKPNFRTTKTIKEIVMFWKKYGGHLAVVTGYRLNDRGKLDGFFVHDPAVGPNKFVSLDIFRRCYTGRAMMFDRFV